VDFGSEAKLDIAGENLKWFDRFLKPAKDPRPFPRSLLPDGRQRLAHW
jgi:hypothetical protein